MRREVELCVCMRGGEPGLAHQAPDMGNAHRLDAEASCWLFTQIGSGRQLVFLRPYYIVISVPLLRLRSGVGGYHRIRISLVPGLFHCVFPSFPPTPAAARRRHGGGMPEGSRRNRSCTAYRSRLLCR